MKWGVLTLLAYLLGRAAGRFEESLEREFQAAYRRTYINQLGGINE